MILSPVSSEVTAETDPATAAARFGTPLFYYSLGRLRDQIATLRGVMRDHPVRLLFATMANDRAEILRAIAGDGVGACVNSIPHLERALAHGFSPRAIQFTSCGLPAADMSYLQSLDIAANLDSPSQIGTWCSLKRGAVVGARINAASLYGSPAPLDRIGMDLDDFERGRQIAERLGGRVNGVHVYAGTNFQTPGEMLAILRGIFDLAGRNLMLDYVNIGGGIGVDYTHSRDHFDYDEYGRGVCALVHQAAARRGRPLTVLLEPGRSMVASSGVFITRVTDIKTLGGTRYVVVDASVSVFPRPYHQPGSYHRARVLGAPDTGGADTIESTIVGRTTFSRDIFGKYDLSAKLEIGSLVAFDDAGAYCESMMSRFLGQREPGCFVSKH